MSGTPGNSGGHNRKTAREKILLGVDSRRIPDTESLVPVNTDPAAIMDFDCLGETGRAFYERKFAELTATRIMGTNETLALHLWARTVEDWLEAADQCRKRGRYTTATDRDGNDIHRTAPWHKAERELWESCMKAAREFGQTPISRESVKAMAIEEKANKWAIDDE